jgi:hypothetical protein
LYRRSSSKKLSNSIVSFIDDPHIASAIDGDCVLGALDQAARRESACRTERIPTGIERSYRIVIEVVYHTLSRLSVVIPQGRLVELIPPTASGPRATVVPLIFVTLPAVAFEFVTQAFP